MSNKKAVCILSGGMDSTLATVMAMNAGYDVIAVHFNYGQLTDAKELESFRAIVHRLKVEESYEIDLPFFEQIGASALTDKSIDVPTHGLEDGVPVTYVPFRNGIFISIATSIAEKHGATALYIGVVQEDSSGYPDCTASFIASMRNSINLGTKDETRLDIITPLIDMKKSEIVQTSLELNSPLELTWSCYKNSTKACGVCDSCHLRIKAFKEAGIVDPIPYAIKIDW